MSKTIRRFIAFLSIACLLLDPLQGVDFGASSAPAPASFNTEAVNGESLGGRYTTPLLNLQSPRWDVLRSLGREVKDSLQIPSESSEWALEGLPTGVLGPALQEDKGGNSSSGRIEPDSDAHFPGDVPQAELEAQYRKYLEEPDHLDRELAEIVDSGGSFVIPKEGIAKDAFDDEGNARKDFGGILVGAIPDQSLKVEFDRLIRNFKGKLKAIVPSDEYEALMKCLVFLDPEDVHLTIAGMGVGSEYADVTQDTSGLLKWVRERTRAIAMFRRSIGFHMTSQIRFMKGWTSCIAVLLKPDSPLDLNRFHTLKTAYGAAMPHRSDQAHVTLIYIRGAWDNKKREWKMTHQQMVWIQQVLLMMEAERTGQEKQPDREWIMDKIDIVGGPFKHPKLIKSVSLLKPAVYERFVRLGIERMQRAWVSPQPVSLDGRSPESRSRFALLDALRGLYAHLHLRNLRAFLAAIGRGRGVVQARDVANLILNSRKLQVRTEIRGDKAHLRVTAHYNHPGLIVALSRALDYAGFVTELKTDGIREGLDPADATIALEITIQETQPGTIRAESHHVVESIREIPDIGEEAAEGAWYEGSLEFLRQWWLRRPSSDFPMKPLNLHAMLPSVPERVSGEESRRTRLLQTLIDIDPHCDVTAFFLQRNGQGPEIWMTVLVPQHLVSRIPGLLSQAIKVPGSVSIDEAETARKRAAKEESPMDILLRRLHLYPISNLRHDEDFVYMATSEFRETVHETIERFQKWLEGQPPESALENPYFHQHLLTLVRLLGASPTSQKELQRDLLITWLQGNTKWTIKENPVTPFLNSETDSASRRVPAPDVVVSAVVDAGQMSERHFVFEIMDFKDREPSAGIYLPFDGDGQPRQYRILLDGRYIEENLLDDVMDQIVKKTYFRLNGLPESVAHRFYVEGHSPHLTPTDLSVRDANPMSPGVLIDIPKGIPGHAGSGTPWPWTAFTLFSLPVWVLGMVVTAVKDLPDKMVLHRPVLVRPLSA